MRRLIVLGTVVGTILVGLAVVPAPVSGAAPAPPKPQAITWGPCSDPNLQAAQAQCTLLSVPLDYSNPGGAKIKLAVSMVRHTTPDSEAQGPILVNPGGPGGSGLIYAILGQFIANGAGNAYDWIGFDPRGVGSSQPALSCLPDYFVGPRPQYVPTRHTIIDQWLARAKSYADACQADAAALLPHMKTTDAARDMDSIRAALGADQINFYGFSYGTYLGQVYATLFPTHVRRMILDSNVDPRYVWYKANLHQDVAFERNIKIWFGWLAKYDSVYHLGKAAGAVERLFYKEEAALRAHPAGGVVGPSEWDDAFLLAGYYQSTWLDLAKVFAGWVNEHKTAHLVAAYEDADGPGDDNGFAVYNAVQCTDVQWPQSWKKWERDNWRTYQVAPFETWGNAWFNAACLYWPAAAGTPVSVDGGTVPALLIDETLDAATPYGGSLEVRKRFPESSLIAEPGGTTHAGTPFGSDCVNLQIADYLATGKLPPRKAGGGADAICQPLPQPIPRGSTATVMAATPSALQTLRTGLLPSVHP